MHIHFKFTAIIAITIVIMFSGCSNAAEDGGTDGSKDDNYGTFTIDNATFRMISVPGGMSFPTGSDDTVFATVENSYWLGETELTFEIWDAVYIWATGDVDHSATINGEEIAGTYIFEHTGRQGGDYAGGAVGTIKHPVTTVNWWESMVFCNALTEYYNEHNGTDTDLNCVYVYTSGNVKAGCSAGDPIRDSSSANGSNCNAVTEIRTNSGFRLPTLDEWAWYTSMQDCWINI